MTLKKAFLFCGHFHLTVVVSCPVGHTVNAVNLDFAFGSGSRKFIDEYVGAELPENILSSSCMQQGFVIIPTLFLLFTDSFRRRF